MNKYDKFRLQQLINAEHGTNYHRNVPLDGYTITLGDAFISFGFREVNGVTIAVIHYIYVTKREDFLALLAYCVNLWSGYGVKMLYIREHRRKSNVVSKLSSLGFDVHTISTDHWTHNWISTNGFAENDCLEAFTPVNASVKKLNKPKKVKK